MKIETRLFLLFLFINALAPGLALAQDSDSCAEGAPPALAPEIAKDLEAILLEMEASQGALLKKAQSFELRRIALRHPEQIPAILAELLRRIESPNHDEVLLDMITEMLELSRPKEDDQIKAVLKERWPMTMSYLLRRFEEQPKRFRTRALTSAALTELFASTENLDFLDPKVLQQRFPEISQFEAYLEIYAETQMPKLFELTRESEEDEMEEDRLYQNDSSPRDVADGLVSLLYFQAIESGHLTPDLESNARAFNDALPALIRYLLSANAGLQDLDNDGPGLAMGDDPFGLDLLMKSIKGAKTPLDFERAASRVVEKLAEVLDSSESHYGRRMLLHWLTSTLHAHLKKKEYKGSSIVILNGLRRLPLTEEDRDELSRTLVEVALVDSSGVVRNIAENLVQMRELPGALARGLNSLYLLQNPEGSDDDGIPFRDAGIAAAEFLSKQDEAYREKFASLVGNQLDYSKYYDLLRSLNVFAQEGTRLVHNGKVLADGQHLAPAADIAILHRTPEQIERVRKLLESLKVSFYAKGDFEAEPEYYRFSSGRARDVLQNLDQELPKVVEALASKTKAVQQLGIEIASDLVFSARSREELDQRVRRLEKQYRESGQEELQKAAVLLAYSTLGTGTLENSDPRTLGDIMEASQVVGGYRMFLGRDHTSNAAATIDQIIDRHRDADLVEFVKPFLRSESYELQALAWSLVRKIREKTENPEVRSKAVETFVSTLAQDLSYADLQQILPSAGIAGSEEITSALIPLYVRKDLPLIYVNTLAELQTPRAFRMLEFAAERRPGRNGTLERDESSQALLALAKSSVLEKFSDRALVIMKKAASDPVQLRRTAAFRALSDALRWAVDTQNAALSRELGQFLEQAVVDKKIEDEETLKKVDEALGDRLKQAATEAEGR